MNTKYLYQCARSNNIPAHFAITLARSFVAGPLANHAKALEAWNAQPDKRRYAPGGSANRPKYPRFPYAMRADDAHGPRYLENGNYASIPTSVLQGLRDCGHVDTIKPDGYALVDHKGWFADADQDEIYRAQVWQLPARNGERVFIAGYSERDSGYSVLDATRGNISLFDSLRDAILRADHCAEHFAKEAREYSERWQEASNADAERSDARNEAKELRAEWRALALGVIEAPNVRKLREMRDEKRAEHREKVAEMRGYSERIAELDMEGEF